MKIEHNSRSELFRTPFGAVCTECAVTLSLALADSQIPIAVVLVLNTESETIRQNMPYSCSLAEYNIYKTDVVMPKEPQLVWYYFEIQFPDSVVYYANNEKNLGGVGEVYSSVPQNLYQITVFDKAYKTPDWFKNSVCYQIFPDRFYRSPNSKTAKDGAIMRVWGDMPYHTQEQFGGSYNCSDFFGGDLLGIIEKLPYLKDLGISVIYLNPIFKAFSNHRYDTGDYEAIDELLGTADDFSALCEQAKKLGIRIILDGVFNHTGSNSKYFNKDGTYASLGAYQSKESPYYSWYRFSSHPDKYESWWGMETLPQVEETNESYQKYILTDENSIIKRWLRAGASGWRLDVADELPDSFIKTLRTEAKSAKSDAVIIGEVWEDASNKIAYDTRREYLLGDELDSVMNYPLRNALIAFAMGRLSAVDFSQILDSLRENYPKESFYSLLNFLSTHDVARVLTDLSGISAPATKQEQAKIVIYGDCYISARKKLSAVLALQMLLPGVPCVFYGDEAGMQGFGDPFCRACFPWGKEDFEIFERTKYLIALRNSSSAFSQGEFETVYAYDMGYAMLRYDDCEKFLVVVNFGKDSCFRLDLARFGITKLTENTSAYSAEDGIFYIKMPSDTAFVFSADTKERS